jgi:polyhydroxybutyrate depolymerase
MRVGLRILLTLIPFLVTLHAAVAAEQPTTMKWTVDGVERQALVFPPAGGAVGKVPVIFAFHGHGGNVRGAARSMKFQTRWPKALVVYMQGLPTPSKRDPEGAEPGWQTEAGQLGDRDLKFFDTALTALAEKYTVDENRIYATGFSNGAFFTYLLWAELGKTFAAFAPCAGRPFPSVHPTEPRPLLHIAGEKDPLVHLEDQKQAIETARQVNGATAPGQPCGTGCVLYPSTKGAPVMARFHPGGHIFPPGATDWIVTFFKEHARPSGT